MTTESPQEVAGEAPGNGGRADEVASGTDAAGAERPASGPEGTQVATAEAGRAAGSTGGAPAGTEHAAGTAGDAAGAEGAARAVGHPATGAEGAAGRAERAFLVIPAVDLLGDQAVRLAQGDFDRIVHSAGDPERLVARFAAAGPAFIHVVDLDGARSGQIRPTLVARLASAARPVPIQASGGIRSLADAEALIAAGAARVVIGTAAFAQPARLPDFVAALGERLVVALDARQGVVALSGWLRRSELSIGQAAELCAEAGVPRLHCTAVERDGTMQGPDLELLAQVRDRSGLPVLAAGGIRSPSDLERLAALGLEGAVAGRALLEGTIPLSVLRAPAGPI